MTTEEFKKKINDAVQPLLDHQCTVYFRVHGYTNSNQLCMCWLDADKNLLTAAYITETPELKLFGYRIDILHYQDKYNKYLDELTMKHSSYTCELGHFYEGWAQIEEILQDFTVYLVKEFN